MLSKTGPHVHKKTVGGVVSPIDESELDAAKKFKNIQINAKGLHIIHCA